MLVYDVTNQKSFDNISKWLRNIEEVKIIIEYFKGLAVQVDTI